MKTTQKTPAQKAKQELQGLIWVLLLVMLVALPFFGKGVKNVVDDVIRNHAEGRMVWQQEGK